MGSSKMCVVITMTKRSYNAHGIRTPDLEHTHIKGIVQPDSTGSGSWIGLSKFLFSFSYWLAEFEITRKIRQGC
jgi:hypothetical protein